MVSRFRIVVLGVLIIAGMVEAFFISSFVSAEREEAFSLAVPYSQGLRAMEEGKYAEAIEAFRKVLFVDGGDLRAQYQLALALLRQGRLDKAYEEWNRFLKLAKKDKRLSASERQTMVAFAERTVSEIRGKRKGLGLLSFFDWNVLILTLFLWIAFLVQLADKIVALISAVDGEEKSLRRVFRDVYWERQADREIVSLPARILNGVMLVLMFFFSVWSCRLLTEVFK